MGGDAMRWDGCERDGMESQSQESAVQEETVGGFKYGLVDAHDSYMGGSSASFGFIHIGHQLFLVRRYGFLRCVGGPALDCQRRDTSHEPQTLTIIITATFGETSRSRCPISCRSSLPAYQKMKR